MFLSLRTLLPKDISRYRNNFKSGNIYNKR